MAVSIHVEGPRRPGAAIDFPSREEYACGWGQEPTDIGRRLTIPRWAFLQPGGATTVIVIAVLVLVFSGYYQWSLTRWRWSSAL
jgi:hypothetical protein